MNASPAALRRTPPSPRSASLMRKLFACGWNRQVGWNRKNSMFAMDAPARYAIATPSPVATSGFEVEVHLAGAAGGEDRRARRDGGDVARVAVEHVCAEHAVRAAEPGLAARHEVDRDVVLLDADAARLAGGEERAFDLAPGRVLACATCLREWPPSRVRCRRSGASRSVSTPSEMRQRIRSGPSRTVTSTASRRHRPAPATSVSWMWESLEIVVGAEHRKATPPWAYCVEPSERCRFVKTRTEPWFAASRGRR